MNSDILTLPEAAAYFRCSPSTIYRLRKTGELKGFKVGAWRFSRSSLDAWMTDKQKTSRVGGIRGG
jgi:excisionase family DNA binding protein